MAFISSSNTSSGKGEVPTASISTASSQVSTISTEMDIKWNLALLSMRANRFWKKTGKKITIQGSDVASFEKSKSQKSAKDKTSVGFNEYIVVSPPPTQVYSSPKKDLSWMGLPEFVDDTVTDYSRPTPSIDVPRDVSESVSFFEQRGSIGNVLSKPMISFVKETDCPSISKVNNTEKSRKPTVKYAEMYKDT
ncbi:hypothetical protein Tco_1004499 [Tanacetum coccineum]|uniref:Uncharacterized protein n=1 Tax=Tanacetum coccineum TaxID=301880 RepID=A0ABQ5FC28_9ASTR